MLTPTHTRKDFEWTFMFIVYYSLCFAIYNKVRGEKFGTHVKQLLDHKPSVILIARFSLFLVYVYRYPREWITKCLARREWIPLYRVGPESISLHREGANPILELSPLLDTLSNAPELILLLPIYGKIHLRTKAHLIMWSNLTFSWSKELMKVQCCNYRT